MKLHPRLLPAVIMAATVLLGLKVSDILSGNGGAVAIDARAQASSPSPAPQGQPVDLTKEANEDAGKQPSDPANPTASAPGGATTGAAQDPIKDPLLLSPSEIEVLQELSKRRVALDQRAGELDQRDVLLQATEKRIDDKIAQLTALQKNIDADAQKEAAADDARIESLVKIYQAMKPKDAAQIMEQLDLPVALRVIEHMKEAKTAPILATMEPAKAKAITMALAADDDRNNSSAPPAQAGAPQAGP